MGLKRWMTTVSVAGVFALSVAGCGEDDPGTKPAEFTDPPATSASPSPEGSSSAAPASASGSTSAAPDVDPEEQAVIDAYKGYYNAVYTVKSAEEADVRAAFNPYAEKPVVDNWVKVFKETAEKDRKPAGYVTFGQIDVTFEQDVAHVYECRDGSTESTVKISDNSVVAQGGPGIEVQAQLRQHDGSWLVRAAIATPNGC